MIRCHSSHQFTTLVALPHWRSTLPPKRPFWPDGRDWTTNRYWVIPWFVCEGPIVSRYCYLLWRHYEYDKSHIPFGTKPTRKVSRDHYSQAVGPRRSSSPFRGVDSTTITLRIGLSMEKPPRPSRVYSFERKEQGQNAHMPLAHLSDCTRYFPRVNLSDASSVRATKILIWAVFRLI